MFEILKLLKRIEVDPKKSMNLCALGLIWNIKSIHQNLLHKDFPLHLPDNVTTALEAIFFLYGVTLMAELSRRF